MNKKNLTAFVMIFLIGILFINIISAIDVSYCCERLKNDGAWCQNAITSECATGTNPFTGESYKKVATSCESTSYCELGTCINSLQGSCMPNTPQVVCNNEGGLWKSENIEDLPECQLGCCLMGNQIAFVTQTECKKLSSELGLLTNYRSDIQTEMECIASVTLDEVGACVFEKSFEKTCLMISQTECNQIKSSTYTGEEETENINIETVKFHKGYLCSAPQLATNCGPRGGTACVDEQVYFMDTCGNPANIYDFSKLNDDNDYWTYIQEPSCDDRNGNKDSKTCGACDYYSGSICTDYTRGQTIKPSYGNSFCGSLDCTYEGENYLHGETWCAKNNKSSLTGQDLPGTRYFRVMCYNGEVSVEPCAEFRNEICIQSSVNNFKTSSCVINKWQDCTSQSLKANCEDTFARYCKWISGYSILKDSSGNDLGKDENNTLGSCVPMFGPGFDFWAGEGSGPELCNAGSSQCVVTYEIGILGNRDKLEKNSWDYRISKCIDNCYCIPGYKNGTAKNKYENNKPASDPKSYDEWVILMNNICTALGDCGNKNNYLGISGDVKEVFTSEFVRKP
jgi:hypothetical protein